MAKTQSENWFEEYCSNVGISFGRIEEEQHKTPDYQLITTANKHMKIG